MEQPIKTILVSSDSLDSPIPRSKFYHFPAKDTKVIDGGGQIPPPQANSLLKRPGEIGLRIPMKVTLSNILMIKQ